MSGRRRMGRMHAHGGPGARVRRPPRVPREGAAAVAVPRVRRSWLAAAWSDGGIFADMRVRHVREREIREMEREEREQARRERAR